MEKKTVNILWTGGYDSTFRMIQLSKLEIDVQPYYICFNKESDQNELKAIEEITKDIKSHSETRCSILPLIQYQASAITANKSISSAHKRLSGKSFLANQYDSLARFALQENLHDLELSLEKADTSTAQSCINNSGG